MLKYIICKSVLVRVGLFSLLTSGNAYSTTYYTALTGSDNYTCVQAASQSTPKQTMHAGAACLQAGDTLLVRAGTYVEEFAGNEVPSGTSWSSPVTIAAYSGESVTIRPGSGADRVFTFLDPQQYIVIDGFIMDARNVTYDAVKITCSGACTANANHIRIQNAEIMNSPNTNGIYLGGDYNEFKHLKVHDNGTVCPSGVGLCHGIYMASAFNLIEDSEWYNNTGYGIHLYDGATSVGAHDNLVRNNIVHDNGSSRDANAGLLLSSGSGNIAYNNIIWNSKLGIQLNSDAINPQVYNNTICGNTVGGIYNNSQNAVIRNNIVYNNATTIQDVSGNAIIDHNYTADPLFVKAASHDFHLQVGSPAINAGVTIPLVSTDIAGASRPQGQSYDIGAYKYTSTQIAAPVLYIK